MDAKKLNQELYDKMAAEQKEYRSWLLEQTPEEILNHAYEYATREDILIEAETVDLPQWQAEALLKLPSPLADIYKDFCDMETDHMRDICMCIEGRADDLTEISSSLKTESEKTKMTAIYSKQTGNFQITLNRKEAETLGYASTSYDTLLTALQMWPDADCFHIYGSKAQVTADLTAAMARA